MKATTPKRIPTALNTTRSSGYGGTLPAQKRPQSKAMDDDTLYEPRIYANKLLGRNVNTKDKIILKNQNGHITKTVVDV
jgi:hypothetical protein